MSDERPIVIVIDDDHHILERMTNLLQDKYQCVTASTATHGLELFNQFVSQNPLVICDIDLPDIIGFDVCEAIKAQHPKTHVMLFSGFNNKELRMKGLSAYADNYLNKTMDDAEIKLLIRNALNTMTPNASIELPINTKNRNCGPLLTDFEKNIKDYISAYYTKLKSHRDKTELSLTYVSAHFNMTPRTFQRKIKEIAGCTYIQFLTNEKLEKSKSMLINRFSITEISETLEYSSPSHYSREFKKHTNMTPNTYKKNSTRLGIDT